MDYMSCFIITEQESKTARIKVVHYLVHQLPEANLEILQVLCEHLYK